MPKYVVISGLYFPAFGRNTGKYGPEITPYLDTFDAVTLSSFLAMPGKSRRSVDNIQICTVVNSQQRK